MVKLAELALPALPWPWPCRPPAGRSYPLAPMPAPPQTCCCSWPAGPGSSPPLPPGGLLLLLELLTAAGQRQSLRAAALLPLPAMPPADLYRMGDTAAAHWLMNALLHLMPWQRWHRLCAWNKWGDSCSICSSTCSSTCKCNATAAWPSALDPNHKCWLSMSCLLLTSAF